MVEECINEFIVVLFFAVFVSFVIGLGIGYLLKFRGENIKIWSVWLKRVMRIELSYYDEKGRVLMKKRPKKHLHLNLKNLVKRYKFITIRELSEKK